MLTKLDRYECEGQIELLDYLKTIQGDKQPVTKYTCTIIGKECKAHSYKGCSMPGKCELLKQAVIGNNPEPKDPEARQLKSEQSEKLSPAQEYYKDTGKTTYWQDSEGKPFQWWKTKSTCEHSGHTCNKVELWKVADTLDDVNCPHSCCRICAANNCGARCNGSEEPKRQPDEYIKENLTCFYVFGHYLDRADGWHKVPEELPMFTPWQKVDVVLFGKKTGHAWMEHGKWEAKDWAFRSVDDRRNTESVTVLAWKLSEEGNT